MGEGKSKLDVFYKKHRADGKALGEEFETLKKEAIKLGIVQA